MRRRASSGAALAAALALTAALPTAAEAPAGELAPRLARAAEAVASLEEARGPALAAAVAAGAAALVGLGEARRAARAEAETLALDLAVRRVETARLMAALQAKVHGRPVPEALHPLGPLAAARAASMLAVLDPALEAEAARVRDVLGEIASARALEAEAAEALRDALPALDAARARLASALAPAVDGSGCCGAEAAVGTAVATLVRESESLSDLAAALDRDAPEAEAAAPDGEAGATAPMALAWPAAGRLAERYAARDAAGVSRPGVALATAPLALVRAPAAGIVRYAGPFLEYGYVVVLEPRPGTQLVLAGLGMLAVHGGERVEAGALVGLVGGRPADPDEDVKAPRAAADATPWETLYIEVRDGGRPIDPEPWFTDGSG